MSVFNAQMGIIVPEGDLSVLTDCHARLSIINARMSAISAQNDLSCPLEYQMSIITAQYNSCPNEYHQYRMKFPNAHMRNVHAHKRLQDASDDDCPSLLDP